MSTGSGAEARYIKDGKPTSELDTIRQALRFLRKLIWAHPGQGVWSIVLEGGTGRNGQAQDHPQGETKRPENRQGALGLKK